MAADISHIGYRHTWGGQEPFGVRADDRFHHVYVIGKTGTGKTTLLRNLLLDDIYSGRGVGLIDPHGDLAESLLDYIPSSRVNDVVYFDPADIDYPPALNILHPNDGEPPGLVASGIVGALKAAWSDSWGPRMEYILYAALAALAECQNTTVLGVQRMLSDQQYRRWVLRQVGDPMVRAFWVNEFELYDPRFMREVIAPIQNKVGQLLMSRSIRNVIGQVRSRISIRRVIDERRIFIGNLSKGRLGEDKSNLLGAMLVSQFQSAAMGRADVPEHERSDFLLFVDEFQNFSSDSFASILSELRKYRLGLVLSHQYIAQLNDRIRDAVFGNVGTLISFRVGESDAERLSREYGDVYPAGHFTALANFQVCARVIERGEAREPFTASTLDLHLPRTDQREQILRRSRQRYAAPRAAVEARIGRWFRSWQ